MQITRTTADTTTGPSEWFTGTVYLDPIAVPADSSRLSAVSVTVPGSVSALKVTPKSAV